MPSDYARYIEYEINLETLRRKRAKRLEVKGNSYVGQRRIYLLLDRATRKFHGDMGLWLQYLDFAQKQKSPKKMNQILTNVLRLLPTKSNLWIYAAKYAIESQGDMTEARSYMQRGLRFCKRSKMLWLEYAKLELMYIAKLSARQCILGLDQPRQNLESTNAVVDPNADRVALPVITAEDINSALHVDKIAEHNVLQNLAVTPALSGAIPIAIFDAAMEEFCDDSLGEKFFDLVATFQSTPCSGTILKHITERLVQSYPNSLGMLSCFIREPTIGIEPASTLFPQALETAFNRFESSISLVDLNGASKIPPKILLITIHKVVDWLIPMIVAENSDPDIHIVLSTILKRALDQYRAYGGEEYDQAALLVGKLQQRGLKNQATLMANWCLRTWPSNPNLLADETMGC